MVTTYTIIRRRTRTYDTQRDNAATVFEELTELALVPAAPVPVIAAAADPAVVAVPVAAAAETFHPIPTPPVQAVDPVAVVACPAFIPVVPVL